jgi:hypothetical protein
MNFRCYLLQFKLIAILLIARQNFASADPQLPLRNFGKQLVDHVDAGVNIGTAVAKKIPDIIPTPDEILEFSKQSIAGLPFEVAASAINKLCKFEKKKFYFK